MPVTKSWTTFCLSVVCMASGCSNHPALQKLNTVPVRGKVTLDGGPLPPGRATITCIWMGPDLGVSNWGVSGSTDESGNFELHTGLGLDHGYTGLLAQKPGAPPGTYRVEIRMYEDFDPERHNWKTPRKSLLPLKYSRSDESGLLLEVVESPRPGAYDFQLRSD